MARFIFYNVGPSRPRDEVYAEIRNFSQRTGLLRIKPRWICFVEASYGDLPDLPGYHKIRDRSKASRANVAVYVRKSRRRQFNHRWVDLDFTWPRIEHRGIHPPRSFPRISDGPLRGAVYHAPDPRAKDVEVGHSEGARAIVQELRRAEGNPLFIPADWNTSANDGVNGAAKVARELGGLVVGGPSVDHAVVRRLRGVRARYRTTWRGRKLGTDHKSGALIVDAFVRKAA